MRIVHVVPQITEEASGPSYSVVRMCQALIDTGADVRLAALDQSSEPSSLPYLKTFPWGIGPHRLGFSPTMRRWLAGEAASGRADLIHSHSLWMMPNVYPGQVCRRHTACRLVVSPRGTLSPWALGLNASQKNIFWRLLQGPALRQTSCFHATAESEYEHIRHRGFTQPVCVLPNGIDVPPLVQVNDASRRQLLFLGRIHPVKGIEVLLQAWRAVEANFPDWDLHVAGPDSRGHLAAMQTLARQLKLQHVVFRGPLYGSEKLRAYRDAELFVLPTHSENFGMAVAEALAAGTPAIVTRGAPWGGLHDEGAGWWIDIGVDPLVASLEEALATSPRRLTQMGLAGRDWMIRDFSWQRTGDQLSATYRWLIEGGSPPACVRLC